MQERLHFVKVCGRMLSLPPIGCTPDLSVIQKRRCSWGCGLQVLHAFAFCTFCVRTAYTATPCATVSNKPDNFMRNIYHTLARQNRQRNPVFHRISVDHQCNFRHDTWTGSRRMSLHLYATQIQRTSQSTSLSTKIIRRHWYKIIKSHLLIVHFSAGLRLLCFGRFFNVF